MLTLKDIKISKTRIPLQNAIWLRPIGGLKFKIYYPHGGSWAELGVTSSSDDDDKTTPSPKPTPTPSSTTKAKMERNIVVCKAINVIHNPSTCHNSYFFGNGLIKIRHFGKVSCYDFISGRKVFTSKKGGVRFRYDTNKWHNPILVTPLTKEEYEKTTEFKLIISISAYTLYFKVVGAQSLTANTTSPYFRIENGYIKCLKTSRLPVLKSKRSTAVNEANKFIVVKYGHRKRNITHYRPNNCNKSTVARRLVRYRLKEKWHTVAQILQRRRIKTEHLQHLLNLNYNRIDEQTVSFYDDKYRTFRFVYVTELYKKRRAITSKAMFKNSERIAGARRAIKREFFPVRK